MALTLEWDRVRHFLDLILMRPPFVDVFSPFEEITSEVWVGIKGSTNFKICKCCALKGELEGRESNICCGRRRIGSKEA